MMRLTCNLSSANLFLLSILFLTALLQGCGSKSALYLPQVKPAAPAQPQTQPQSDQPVQIP